MKNHAFTEWRPIAHVTVEDSACRTAIIDALRRRGWSVVEEPTGLHLIHAISGIILGDQPWLRPGWPADDRGTRERGEDGRATRPVYRRRDEQSSKRHCLSRETGRLLRVSARASAYASRESIAELRRRTAENALAVLAGCGLC